MSDQRKPSVDHDVTVHVPFWSVVTAGDPIEGLGYDPDVDEELMSFEDGQAGLVEYFEGNRAFFEAHADEIRAAVVASQRIAQGFVPDVLAITESGWI